MTNCWCPRQAQIFNKIVSTEGSHTHISLHCYFGSRKACLPTPENLKPSDLKNYAGETWRFRFKTVSSLLLEENGGTDKWGGGKHESNGQTENR